MKITEILVENLGNLHQLNAPQLLNVFKQDSWFYPKRGHNAGSDDPKIKPNALVSNTSEIKEIGNIKSISDLKKAYKNTPSDIDIKAFALKVGDITVMIGRFDSEQLAGRTRQGLLAWDFSKFEEPIKQIYDEINKDKSNWQKISPPNPKSAYDKEHRNYDWKTKQNNPTFTHYTGVSKSTEDLGQLIEVLHKVSVAIKQPLKLFLIMPDFVAIQKRNSRQQLKLELSKTGDDLKTRLAKYKLSKKPTAKSIQEFVHAVMNKTAKQIQFAGATYNTTSETGAFGNNINMSVEALFNGTLFKAGYKNALENSYGTIDVWYSYDRKSGGIVPVYATYYPKDRDTGYKEVTDIIDPRIYARKQLVVNPDNKDSFIRGALSELKNNQYARVQSFLNVAKMLGHDWPELKIIEKSLKAELNKDKNDEATEF